MDTRPEDRAREAGIGNDAGALPKAVHDDARPFEIADPVAVKIEHDLCPLRQYPAFLGRGGALIGDRLRGGTVHAYKAMTVRQLLQTQERLFAPRRPRADEQDID